MKLGFKEEEETKGNLILGFKYFPEELMGLASFGPLFYPDSEAVVTERFGLRRRV